MLPTLIPDTPKKQQHSKPIKKNRGYKFKKGSTLVLYFPRLTEYTKHYKTMMNNTLIQMQCQEATNIVVWVGKQNRYSIIKGYVNQYQLDIIEVEVENMVLRYGRSKYLYYYKPYNVLDFSHVPPEAKFVNDEL